VNSKINFEPPERHFSPLNDPLLLSDIRNASKDASLIFPLVVMALIATLASSSDPYILAYLRQNVLKQASYRKRKQ
jgi:Na+-transporting methylmalonyl-CoA/oxaloacetate decarboxylase beta subunit